MNKPSLKKKSQAERIIEIIIFGSRWVLVPFYLGLVIGLLALLLRFGLELEHLMTTIMLPENSSIIISVLRLIDLTLSANLVLIIIFSGYENFVSHLETTKEYRPSWMSKISLSSIQIKLISSMAAISGIYLLEALLNISSQGWEMMIWKVAIFLTFVASGVLLALMDWIESRAG